MHYMTNLISLLIHRNKIVDMQDPDSSICRMSGLEILNISNNAILDLPAIDRETGSPGIEGMASLSNFNLAGNRLLAIPASIGKLTNMEDLNLASNRIQWLPVDIGKLALLRQLNITGNPVVDSNPELAPLVHDPAKVVTFFKANMIQDLSRKALCKVPEFIAEKHFLQVLKLSRNELKILPPDLNVLRHLHTLHADYNQLFLIEPWIGHLTGLTDLALDYNKLVGLPRELGSLTALVKLTVAGNILSNLPRELGQCTNLTVISLEKNPLRAPVSDAFEEGGMLGVLGWLQEVGSQLKPPTRVSTRETMRHSRMSFS
mmetsp:Transcript_2460/g.3963  ORF Transcript_2460/g.3963 Transcript_2460/m.3963 type:complete len:317 (+) Transcript_2460:61-1011(+)|eukprot:CAMPEP_0184296248 /NCGR_PEP_ID=MMETSP1049-20130417/7222_1 /TAXON_ID=77928 /ORGANISM="Proteomonas sulcata, Strain CCMP704" /LENGTH=316 /DNA_ID=CAMNT_0026605371 /DNA_START=57 /DNA_END=1007 /DNA_ORIENTATION=+